MAIPDKAGQDVPRPVKAVSESTRERETFKYDPFLYAGFRFNNTGTPIPSAEIVSSGDSVLTALAQLGAYQTGAERAFVSLFDAGHQYVVAEAVPTMSLAPYLPSGRCPQPLALCGIAIPRSHGTCEHVLYLENHDAKDNDAELPYSLVPNLAADERFNKRPYCQFGETGQFYAAVPIRTQRGINIGSFCIMSAQKPLAWDDQSINCLRDVSRAIMDHLAANRSKHANFKSERMNRGVRAFINGDATLPPISLGQNLAALDETVIPDALLDPKQQQPSPQGWGDGQSSSTSAEAEMSPRQEWRSIPKDGNDEASHSDSSGVSPRRHRTAKPPSASGRARADAEGRDRARQIFTNAACIMRESFEVEGCLFYDVGLGSYRRLSVPDANGVNGGARGPYTGSSDERSIEVLAEGPDALSELLGFSVRHGSSMDAVPPPSSGVGSLHKKTMAKLLRRYPSGTIFNFDAVGELQSSDSSDDDEALKASRAARGSHHDDVNGSLTTAEKRRHRRFKEAALLRGAFPEARSVAFIPVWDLKRERWLSAAFLYTSIPARFFTVEGDLSFLKAFANLTATEVLNQEILQATQAKSDALGSLSHELRTPLHGALLGAELLKDTELDVFQGNLTHTIETCCCTLLDTIDHLLDYTKVNNLAAKRKQHSRAVSNARKKPKSDQFGKKQLLSDVELDCLLEEVVESMFAGYSFQHQPVKQVSGMEKRSPTAVLAYSRGGVPQTVQERLLNGDPDQQHLDAETVAVYLSIDRACSWLFHVEAGAIRRIIMNLLGNALKYTSSGSIWISLTQDNSPPARPNMQRKVKLTVKDTGKGIGEDFLQHQLFMPFSQEDELAPGTGLGLSMTKTIVSGLDGQIRVKSQVGVGSTFTVTLPLELSSQPSELPTEAPRVDTLFEEQARDLAGLRVRLHGFEATNEQARTTDGHAILESICRDWLRLDLSTGENTTKSTPDLVIWSYEALPDSAEELVQLAKTPNIIVCHNSVTAYRRSAEYDSAGYQGVFEFISQPYVLNLVAQGLCADMLTLELRIGPRKLARSMHLAYKRWTGLTQAKSAPTPRPPGPSRACSSQAGELSMAEPVAVPSPPIPELAELSVDPRPSVHENGRLRRSASDASQATSLGKEMPQAETQAPGGTFLLVDDNHINLKVLSAYMKQLDLAYVTATNGKEAVDAYVENPGRFTAVLMDISMPVMDGLEATRQMRAYEQWNQLSPVAILALTGLASDRTHQEALESGVDVFLTKPVRLQTLRQHLGSLITSPGAREG